MQMLKCIELDERLKAMDQEITVNPQFVQKVMRVPLVIRSRLGGEGGALSHQAQELSFRLLNIS